MREFAGLIDGGDGSLRGIAALTFDDGTVDQGTLLPGLLEELDVPGTVYVCPGLAGDPYPWAAPDAGVRFMSEADLVALDSHPLTEIGAHTNRHTELHEADSEMAFEAMTSCKQTLESLLGGEIVSFCYPRCHYSTAAREAAPRAGYTSAVTCGLRGSGNAFELRREVFHTDDGPWVTRLKLRGAYAGLGGGLAKRGARRVVRAFDQAYALGSTRASTRS